MTVTPTVLTINHFLSNGIYYVQCTQDTCLTNNVHGLKGCSPGVKCLHGGHYAGYELIRDRKN